MYYLVNIKTPLTNYSAHKTGKAKLIYSILPVYFNKKKNSVYNN